jgi:hypothetical protein
MGDLALGADAVRPLPALARITGRDVLMERYEEIAPDPLRRPYKYIAPASAAKRLGSPSQTIRPCSST